MPLSTSFQYCIFYIVFYFNILGGYQWEKTPCKYKLVDILSVILRQDIGRHITTNHFVFTREIPPSPSPGGVGIKSSLRNFQQKCLFSHPDHHPLLCFHPGKHLLRLDITNACSLICHHLKLSPSLILFKSPLKRSDRMNLGGTLREWDDVLKFIFIFTCPNFPFDTFIWLGNTGIKYLQLYTKSYWFALHIFQFYI